MTVAASLVLKAKKRKPTYTKGKRGEPGRFVTLKSGRVIFIPEGKRTKWADVKDKVMASKEKSLEELSRMRPDEVTRPATGIEITFIADFGEYGKALVKNHRCGSAASEILAYEFSESIGWGIVPETIGTGRETTHQRWIEGSHTFNEEPVAERRTKPPEFLVMDALLGNTDRHGGNCLIGPDGKVWAIDNNQSFRPTRQMSGEPVRYMYSHRDAQAFAEGKVVTREWAGLKRAAQDIGRWRGTPAYKSYVERVRTLLGDQNAGYFERSAAILAEWGDEVEVVDRRLTFNEIVGAGAEIQ